MTTALITEHLTDSCKKCPSMTVGSSLHLRTETRPQRTHMLPRQVCSRQHSTIWAKATRAGLDRQSSLPITLMQRRDPCCADALSLRQWWGGSGLAGRPWGMAFVALYVVDEQFIRQTVEAADCATSAITINGRDAAETAFRYMFSASQGVFRRHEPRPRRCRACSQFHARIV